MSSRLWEGLSKLKKYNIRITIHLHIQLRRRVKENSSVKKYCYDYKVDIVEIHKSYNQLENITPTSWYQIID